MTAGLCAPDSILFTPRGPGPHGGVASTLAIHDAFGT